jgi:hypothetical protein
MPPIEEKKDAPKPTTEEAKVKPLAQPEEPPVEEVPEHVETNPLIASGLGLITVLGNDMRYVGKAPESEDAETMGGIKIHSRNSTIQPLHLVPFDRGYQIKDPESGDFYYPDADDNAWTDVEYNGVKLVPPLPEPKDSKKAKASNLPANEPTKR